MRAISPIANYGITLVHPTTRRGPDVNGQVVEWTDGQLVHAQFSRGGLTEWEQVVALELFDFSGLPEGVNPLTRCSVFDSEGYVEHMPPGAEREDLQKRIEERLSHFAKLFPSEFVLVVKPAAERPWPSYDTTPLEDQVNDDTGRITLGFLSMIEQTGKNPQDIRLYEVENENRPEVVETCETLEALVAGGLDLSGAIDQLRAGDVTTQSEAITVDV